MASLLVASSSIATTGESCWRRKRCANNYFASSYITRALWHKTDKLSKEYCNVTSLQQNLKYHYKGIDGGTKCEKFERKYFMNATSKQSDEYESQAHDSKSISQSIKDVIDIVRTFSRPVAMISMILAILCMSLLAVERLSDLSPTFFIGFSQYLVAFLCMQLYNVGLNQLADVEIDKINKPYLPLASGQFSFRTVSIVVASSLFMSLMLGWIVGSRPMLWALFASFVLATAYSMNLPLLRWKRFPMLTLVYMVAYPIIGIILGPFLHMKTYVLKRAATYPRSMMFTILIVSIFGTVLAFLKDIPDIEGDKALGIRTLSIRFGPKPVFWFCVSLLEMAYGIAILIGATSPFLWSKVLLVLTHAVMALILWYQAKSVDLESKYSFQSFYITVFKLVSAEYILALFVR